ncbi:MAG TPA: hypothetical protein DCP69_04125 [Candidatus Omnitrophica bacterium]|nr:hypothetical protein [Candidatus Omnitrophota bacterium]
MTPGRQDNGRFAKGNPGGPGRKPRPVEEGYLDLFREGVPPARAKRIIEKAASQAEHGDAKAREWLFNYLAGKPADKIQVSGAGGSAFRVVIDIADTGAGDQGLPYGAEGDPEE